MTRDKMIISGFLLPSGCDERAWRLSGSRSDELGQFGILQDIARAYERAKLDSVFIADVSTAEPILSGNMKFGNPYEPVTALSALAGVTERIGLIGTISTTFNHPFTVARQLAALDVLSNGRAGWNVVTSFVGAEGYGIELPSKEERYRRAAEFVEIVTRLWQAWDDDAVINDRSTGRWVDPERIHPMSHEGEFFTVSGFLNQRRSPQGQPVIVQAGQSSSGLDFGSSVAEVVYTAQPHRETSIEQYAAYKARVARKGRDPENVKILPGLFPYLGDTEAEAQELYDSLEEFLDIDVAREKFAAEYDLELADLELDEPIPAERFGDRDDDSAGTRFTAFRLLAAGGQTLRQLLLSRHSTSGHLMLIGTPSKVADAMVDWFESRACDGFSLNAPIVPISVSQICERLIPELQDRGYFKEDYEETTLRGHLGIPKPVLATSSL